MSKRRLPYMPFWVDDYRRDTRHLNTEEHGAYLLLLMTAWETPSNSLPDDDDMLARIAGVTPAKWKRMKPLIMAFWDLDGRSKRWVQKRLRKERRLAVDRKQKAMDAAATRWNEKKKGDAKPMLAQCHPSITTKEEPNGSLPRAGARKPSGFVHVRKTTDAINDVIQEIRDDAERIGIGSEGDWSDVPMLPAVGSGRS